MNRFSRFCVLSVCVVVLCSLATVANATIITTDGDFGNQSNGVLLTAPWNLVNKTYGSTSTQSPFTNVFANNSKEAHWVQGAFDNTTYDPGFNQSFTSIPSTATGLRYVNVDFMLNRTDTTDGGFTFYVTRDFGQQFSTSAVYINSAGIYAQDNSGLGTKILTPALGTWYNMQLTLDMTNNQYSGMITRAGTLAQTAISTRNFAHEENINGLLVWNYMHGELPRSILDTNIDNVAISNTAFASPLPEPSTLALLATGLIGLLAYAWRKRK